MQRSLAHAYAETALKAMTMARRKKKRLSAGYSYAQKGFDEDVEQVRLEWTWKRMDAAKRIAFAEVYAPDDLDSHNEFMRKEHVEDLAHRFLMAGRTRNVDVNHDNLAGRAAVVQSFIADPAYVTGFTPYAWVAAFKVFDDQLWADVESNQKSGVSVEMLVRKRKMMVETDTEMKGTTDVADGHKHSFDIQMNANGRVTSGRTGETQGHWHPITQNLRTEVVDGHFHTFSMKRPVRNAA